MEISKNNLVLFITIVLFIIGALAHTSYKNREDRDKALREKQEEKEEVIRIRDSAKIARNLQIDIFERNLDSLLEVNKKIIYVPYEKLKYPDRTLDDAIFILNSTKYEKR